MKRKFFVVSLLALALLLGAAGYIVSLYEKSLVRQVYYETESQLSSKVLALKSIVDRNFNLMIGLEAYVTSNYLEGHNEAEIIHYLKSLYEGTGSSALNLFIAPDSIVRFVYPTKGNDIFLNWDLLHDPRAEVQQQLRQAFLTRHTTIFGPFRLLQGNQGLVARKAIYRDGQLWGFVSVGLDMSNILQQAGFIEQNDELQISIRIPGQSSFYGNDSIFENKQHLHSSVDLTDINWEVAALPNPDQLDAVKRQIGLVRGMSFTGILMMYAMYDIVIYQRENLRSIVRTRTRQLQAKNEELSFINSALRESEHRLSYLAYYDPLTGISNRASFQARLKELLERTEAEEVSAAIIFFDLDNFKIVNDTYGHQTGDQLLVEVAERIVNEQLPVQLISRFGGDEFAILVTNFIEEYRLQQLAEKLLALFKEPFFIANHLFFVAPSIGIAQYPSGGTSLEALLKNADIAMYMAKREGGNSFKFFNQSMESDSLEKLEMGNHLRQAMERGELEIHYQPQVDCVRGQMIGIEALLRWKHTTRGYISPSLFIPLAEELNLIMPIGDWVLRQACMQMKEFQQQYDCCIRLSVNLSVKQLQDKHVVDNVRNILEESGLVPECLELEITENVAMKDEQFDVLRELRQLGVAISVDDFGTQYSSLSYLKRFPVTKIKLDQSFVRGIHNDSKDRAMIKAIIYVAQSFNLEIIAEGVEVEEQASFLVENGCSQIQGYYFYKPMHLSSISEILQEDLTLKLAFRKEGNSKMI